MTPHSLPIDPLWPRAGQWIVADTPGETPPCDIAIVGLPAHRTSLSPTTAHKTPAAVREALQRYSTYAGSRDIDVSTLLACDLGDVADPDGVEGEERARAACARAATRVRDRGGLVIAIGGDNSVTFSAMRGVAGWGMAEWGLITIDAHHDLRDGESNGSPVRRLLEAGLPGDHVVQVGIADFANSAAYARRAREHGITVVSRADVRGRPLARTVASALEVAGAGGRPVFVDIDVDVCDRSAVPGCPAAAPGGLSADELREMAFLLALDERVKGIDITEVDAGADAEDGRTVRLAALLVLEAAAGLRLRK